MIYRNVYWVPYKNSLPIMLSADLTMPMYEHINHDQLAFFENFSLQFRSTVQQPIANSSELNDAIATVALRTVDRQHKRLSKIDTVLERINATAKNRKYNKLRCLLSRSS